MFLELVVHVGSASSLCFILVESTEFDIRISNLPVSEKEKDEVKEKKGWGKIP